MKKFYICEKCGNLIEMIEDSGMNPVCCGQEMRVLIPGETDGTKERHIPICKCKDNCVKIYVGKDFHPMEDDHYIQWIVLETDKGVYRRHLSPGEEPKACFMISKHEMPKAAYSYCNKHGLWYASLIE